MLLLLLPPGGNIGMVSVQQDIGHFQSPKFRRARVLRGVQEVGLERISQERLAVVQHAGNQAHNGIDHDQGRQLPSRQHIIPDRDLLVNKKFPDPFIHSFIAATKEDEVRLG